MKKEEKREERKEEKETLKNEIVRMLDNADYNKVRSVYHVLINWL